MLGDAQVSGTGLVGWAASPSTHRRKTGCLAAFCAGSLLLPANPLQADDSACELRVPVERVDAATAIRICAWARYNGGTVRLARCPDDLYCGHVSIASAGTKADALGRMLHG